MNAAFEDATFQFHMPQGLRAGSFETEANQFAGTGLVSLEEGTSNDPDDLLALLNTIIRVVNKSREG